MKHKSPPKPTRVEQKYVYDTLGYKDFNDIPHYEYKCKKCEKFKQCIEEKLWKGDVIVGRLSYWGCKECEIDNVELTDVGPCTNPVNGKYYG